MDISLVKVYDKSMETDGMSDKAIFNRELVKSTRGAMLRGEITLAEARTRLQPVIDEMNKRAKEIAKEFGMPYKPIKFTSLMR
jgi:hypothetical protein